MSLDNDDEILKTLGIINDNSPSRLRTSPITGGSANFEDVKIDDIISSTAIINDISDGYSDDGCQIIFDKNSPFLKSHVRAKRTRRKIVRNRIMFFDKINEGGHFCKGALVCAGFFVLGLCLSIIGPTLPDIQAGISADNIVSVVLIVSVNGFGSLIGVIFGGFLYSIMNPFLLMSTVLCFCAFVTVAIPWCTTVTGVFLVCFLQGVCFGTIERGGYSFFYAYWSKRYRFLQLFYISMAFGACLAPLIASPFFFNNLQPRLNRALLQNDILNMHRFLFKRSIGSDLSSNATDINSQNSTTKMITKPMIAEGADRVKSMGEINKENREQASIKAEDQAKISSQNSPDVKRTDKLFSIGGNTTENHMQATTPSFTSTRTTAVTTTLTKLSTTTDSIATTTTTTTTETTRSISSTISIPKTTSSSTTSLVHYFNRPFWHRVSSEIRQFNNTRLAYSLVGLISLLFTVLFLLGFFCCFIPCRATATTLDGSNRLSDYPVQSTGQNRLCIGMALLFAMLVSIVEANMSNLLTIYELEHHHLSQANGALLTSLFWFGMTLGRSLIAVGPNFTRRSTTTLTVLLVVGTLSASLLAVFGAEHSVILWTTVLMLSLAWGPVFPLSFCWLDQRLQLGPWMHSLWLVASAFGRIIGPITTAHFMTTHGARFLLLHILICTLFSSVIFMFMPSVVRSEPARLCAIDQLNEKQGNDSFDSNIGSYVRMNDNGDLEMDNFSHSIDPDLVHFDRHDSLFPEIDYPSR